MKKQTLFLLLASALLIGIGTYVLTKPVLNKSAPPLTNDVKNLEQQVATLKVTHLAQTRLLDERNILLQSNLSDTKHAIYKSNKQVQALQVKVKQHANEKLQNDTLYYLSVCDDLQQQANSFIEAKQYQDSLTQVQTNNYENLLDVKDSIIHNFQNDYSVLQHTTDTLFSINDRLVKENRTLHKSLLRKQRKVKWLSGTALVVAGIATATQLSRIN